MKVKASAPEGAVLLRVQHQRCSVRLFDSFEQNLIALQRWIRFATCSTLWPPRAEGGHL